MEAVNSTSVLDWGVAARGLGGARESGDLHLVRETPEGMLLAVMDGLGHGPEAAVAARLCASVLDEYANEGLDETIARCHVRLQGTRGVAISMCFFQFSEASWSWIGVGNVAGVLLRAGGKQREFLMQRSGVVGRRLPRVTVSRLRAEPEDTLVLATDGIRADFSHEMSLLGGPQQIAERILGKHATGSDDALALVARYPRGPA